MTGRRPQIWGAKNNMKTDELTKLKELAGKSSFEDFSRLLAERVPGVVVTPVATKAATALATFQAALKKHRPHHTLVQRSFKEMLNAKIRAAETLATVHPSLDALYAQDRSLTGKRAAMLNEFDALAAGYVLKLERSAGNWQYFTSRTALLDKLVAENTADRASER